MQATTRPLIALMASLALVACDQLDREPEVALGTVEFDRIELSSPFSEPIVEILVEEGQPIAAGTLILRLDDSRLQARAAQLEAERRQATARLDEVLRGPRREMVAADRARLDGALAELEDATADLARQRELRAQGLVAQAEVDRAEARYGRAQAARDEAAQVLEAAVEGSTQEEIEQARQRLAAAEAAVQLNAVDLEKLQIIAPIDGHLDTLPYELGEMPPAGATLAILLETARPYARIYLPEPYRAVIGPGDDMEITLQGQQVNGVIKRVATDPVYTPYYALTEDDRSRLAYLTEVDLPGDIDAGYIGIPIEARLPVLGDEQ